MLEPGLNAQRTATYFLQDGEYQEKVLRKIEAMRPDIEHLDNWHTHHIEGYPALSSGAKDTYFRTVNHRNHSTDFFYALPTAHLNFREHAAHDAKREVAADNRSD